MAPAKNTTTSPSGPPNEALVAARWDGGLSQDALAKKARVTLRTVQRLERGYKPQPATAKAVADVLGLKPSDLWPPAVFNGGRRKKATA